MKDIQVSYSSANVFPAKILYHEELINKVKHGIVPAIHVQFNPTNRCNLNCPFCSCSSRNRDQELSLEDTVDIMVKAKMYGCESITITGGGDPLLHPKICGIIEEINRLGIQIGMVPNGTALDRLSKKDLSRIVWIRISASDYLRRELQKIGKDVDWWFDTIDAAVSRGRRVDWAFSYVLSNEPDLSLIKRIVEFANYYEFTHIRLVNDIFHGDKLAHNMADIKNYLMVKNVDDSLVNYQARAKWTHGNKKCYISLLKPVVGADGYVYPCCGTQYALANPSRDYEVTMRMGLAKDLDKIYEQMKPFDGSSCVKCYYENYNWALNILMSKIKHQKFV